MTLPNLYWRRMFSYRVKNMEVFKDGNILGERVLKPGEILVVDAVTKQKIEQSGGVLEVLETVVPNPMRAIKPEETPALKEVGESKVLELPKEVTVEEPPVKRKAGRPRKNG